MEKNPMRNKREMTNLVGGLIIGLIVGILIAAAGGDSLFGTASDPNNNRNITGIEVDPSKFYLVEFDAAQGWLSDIDPDSREEIDAALGSVEGLITAEDFESYASDAETQAAINIVLAAIREALLSQGTLDGVTNFNTCLGIDRNPYSLSGPGLYLYVELPQSGTSGLSTTFTENEASGPHESDILWSTACYKGDAADK
jgi:hypothetical protein